MTPELLKNVWYVGMLSQQLRPGKMKSYQIMGEPVVFFRDEKGVAQALRDICPHRGIPLSYGKVKGNQVECAYHGWKFGGDGVCAEIPSLCEGQNLDCRKIKVRSFPVREQQGLIWIFYGDKDFDMSSAPPIPLMKVLPMDVQPNVKLVDHFNCHIDHAVIGLMDPAHGPFIHKSYWWRPENSIIEKRKKFVPVDFGFQMARHQPSVNSRAYKILGKEKTTEITFTLPSVRVEHVEFGRYSIYSYTALTPVNQNQTRIHQMLYWDFALLTFAQPIIKKFAKAFLQQDIDAVNMQQEGLRFEPALMLINDADTQAKWYYALKNEWLKQPTQFQNPVKETELRWRS